MIRTKHKGSALILLLAGIAIAGYFLTTMLADFVYDEKRRRFDRVALSLSNINSAMANYFIANCTANAGTVTPPTVNDLLAQGWLKDALYFNPQSYPLALDYERPSSTVSAISDSRIVSLGTTLMKTTLTVVDVEDRAQMDRALKEAGVSFTMVGSTLVATDLLSKYTNVEEELINADFRTFNYS